MNVLAEPFPPIVKSFLVDCVHCLGLRVKVVLQQIGFGSLYCFFVSAVFAVGVEQWNTKQFLIHFIFNQKVNLLLTFSNLLSFLIQNFKKMVFLQNSALFQKVPSFRLKLTISKQFLQFCEYFSIFRRKLSWRFVFLKFSNIYFSLTALAKFHCQ